MSNQADHTIVRLRVPPELKEKIEKAAEENNRSQSAEMVSRLEESFNTPMSFDPGSAEMVTKLVAKSMEHLLIALHNQGVDDVQLNSAIKEVSEKTK